MHIERIKPTELKTKTIALLAASIIALVGFQQFPVIRMGGSFKIYEMLAIILIASIPFSTFQLKRNSLINQSAFLFFVLSPVLSYIISLIEFPYPYKFFDYYPQVDSFKFNYYVYPFLQLIYMFLNYAVIATIINTDRLYEYFPLILKICILIGTCIALYSLMAMFIADPIADLPKFIQYKKKYHFRSQGLSQEPSFYVLYQGWIFLFCLYSRKLFSPVFWSSLTIINLLALVLTLSTTLLGFFASILLSIFLLRNSFATRAIVVISICVFIALVNFFLIKYHYHEVFTSYFVDKINNFVTSPTNTIGSGGFRNYTARIGFEIFKTAKLSGVGVGNSIYYMFPYEFRMGIIIFGERLFPGVFPQNLYTLVLCEQGIIGFFFLLTFLAACFHLFWKNRNESGYHKMFFIGFLFNLIALVSVHPQYSLFLWVYISFGIGYVFYYKKRNTLLQMQVS